MTTPIGSGVRVAPPPIDFAETKHSSAVSRAEAPLSIGEQTPKAEAGTFAKVLTQLSESSTAHEHTIDSLTHGHVTLDPVELLALQQDVARHTTVVELASKLAEQGTQSIQTVLRSGGQ